MEGQAGQEAEPKECFTEGLCVFIPPLTFSLSLSLSLSVSILLVLYSSSLSPVPQSLWNDAHSFPLSHLHLFLSVFCPFLSPSHPPHLPPFSLLSPSMTLNDHGESYSEFRQSSDADPVASLFSAPHPPSSSTLTRESLPWLPPDTGSTPQLGAPSLAVVIQSPVPQSLRLIRRAAASALDIGLTVV